MRSPTRRLLALAVLLAAGTARAQSAKPLARYVPDDSIGFYAEFAGTDAHAAAWKRTAFHKFLNDTTAGAAIEDLALQGLTRAMADLPPGRPSAAEVVALAKHVFRSGFVAAVHHTQAGEANLRGVLAFRGAGRKEVRPIVDKLLAAGKMSGPGARKATQAGRELTSPDAPGMPSTWWVEKGEDLVVCFGGGGADAVLDALDGKAKGAEAQATRVELSKVEKGFQPLLVAFADVAPLAAGRAEMGQFFARAKALGIQRVDVRWGFQADALLSVTRVLAPSPRKGVLAILDTQPTFDAKSLPMMPKGLTGFTALSISPRQLFDRFVAFETTVNPQTPAQVAQAEQQLQEGLGLRLKEDLLDKLGPKVAAYVAPGPKPAAGAAPPNLAAALAGPFPPFTIAVDTPDGTALAKTVDTLMAVVNQQLKAQPQPAGAAPMQFTKVPGGLTAYTLAIPPQVMQGPQAMMMATVKPTVVVGKTHLFIAANADAAAKALALEDKAADRRVATELPPTLAAQLPPKMLMLSVGDPRDTLPALLANLPSLLAAVNLALSQQPQPPRPGGKPFAPITLDAAKVPTAEAVRATLFPSSAALSLDAKGLSFTTRDAVPVVGNPATAGIGVALLLPAVQSAREAARRAQCVYNLKQQALAMHNYLDANGTFPAKAILSKAGKPLLSWRVTILPFIEQGELYGKFKLDEPWDSPNNKPLIGLMPKTFACPSNSLPVGMTPYRLSQGPGAMADGDAGARIKEVTDGTSNTLLIVETADGVEWTKPDPLALGGANNPLTLLGSNHPGGFNSAFADGSVRFIKKSIAEVVLQALITRSGGEFIDVKSY